MRFLILLLICCLRSTLAASPASDLSSPSQERQECSVAVFNASRLQLEEAVK